MNRRRKFASMRPLCNTYYVKKAVRFLQENEPAIGYFISFSGGKDSIVVLELCKMAGVKYEAYYVCTRIDPPEIYSFIKKHHSEVKWLYPSISFWEGIRKKGVPFRTRRWCCNTLKKDPSKYIYLRHRIMGIRAEESYKRAKRPQIEKRGMWTLYKPIFNWLEWQVWDFIDSKKLPYPSLYDEGFDRIGCVVCPFLTKQRTEKAKNKWPQIYKVFEKVVDDWWEPYKYKDYKTSSEFLKYWYDN